MRSSNKASGDAAPEQKSAAETIETHISRVFLTEKFVLKQKKPVDYGFVDYTSLKKRIFFSKRELSLNRRACSGIYIDIQELRQKKDKFFVGFRGGTLKDVYVRMRRIEPKNFLNNILKENCGSASCGEESAGILKKTAKKIYLFHKTARNSKRISGFGSIGVYRANWDDNLGTVEEEMKKIGADFKSVSIFSSSFLESPLFAEFIRMRSESGFVRDVHGDLRMEHIAVLDRRRVNGICLMDCVEFDERYRCQDIYLDIAFLLMDFEKNGYFYESAVFFGYYKNFFNYAELVEPFEKYEPTVIPFFKAYRALVRTKISLLSPGADSAAKALKYYHLADFYLSLAKKKTVILNCGLSGSGKSSLSALLAGYFYARVFSSDEIRRNLFDSADKSLKYSSAANIAVYKAMLDEGLKEFENGKGGGVIFDATFLRRSHREKVINAFSEKDCIFIIAYSKVYCEKEEIILKRIAERSGGTYAEAGYSEADSAVYFNQKQYLEEPSEAETEPLNAEEKEIGAMFIQIDASQNLKDRFNSLMDGIVKKKTVFLY
jgi:hypothetical protein